LGNEKKSRKIANKEKKFFLKKENLEEEKSVFLVEVLVLT
jgi:hypothetical protein